MKTVAEWAYLCHGTSRLQVIGGWLVRCSAGGGQSLAVTFVADPEHAWVVETR